jgi:hypothetical protein
MGELGTFRGVAAIVATMACAKIDADKIRTWLTFEMAPSKLRLGSDHPYNCQFAEH